MQFRFEGTKSSFRKGTIAVSLRYTTSYVTKYYHTDPELISL